MMKKHVHLYTIPEEKVRPPQLKLKGYADMYDKTTPWIVVHPKLEVTDKNAPVELHTEVLQDIIGQMREEICSYVQENGSDAKFRLMILGHNIDFKAKIGPVLTFVNSMKKMFKTHLLYSMMLIDNGLIKGVLKVVPTARPLRFEPKDANDEDCLRYIKSRCLHRP